MANNTVIIRDGNISDAEAVRLIAYPIMKSFGIEPDPNGLDYEIGHFGENYVGSVAQLVASLGSRIVGSIILKRHRQNDGKISGFYVDSKYRGQGAGHLLLTEAVNRAKLSGLGGVYLDTLDKMDVAVTLYQKFGWKQIEDPPPNSGAQRRYFLRLL